MAPAATKKATCKFLAAGKCQSTGLTCTATLTAKSCPMTSGSKLDREIAKHGPSAQRQLDAFFRGGE